ncbi:MAG: hypothetical protein ACLQPN_21690, partial [Bryobacteraceae bacterium]
KERIDLILSAIQRAHINVVSTRIIGWPKRTAKVREAPATRNVPIVSSNPQARSVPFPARRPWGMPGPHEARPFPPLVK